MEALPIEPKTWPKYPHILTGHTDLIQSYTPSKQNNKIEKITQKLYIVSSLLVHFEAARLYDAIHMLFE